MNAFSASFFPFSDDSAGSAEIGDAADLVSTERRLKALKDAADDITRIGIKCFLHLAPRESYEGSFTQFLRWVGQVPVVTDWWNRSSARQGAALALALAKSYFPALNFNTITSGFPAQTPTGQAFTDDMILATIDSASAYARRVERFVITDNYMPTIVPAEDSQNPPEHMDYASESPFHASLNGTLMTYPPPEFVVTDPKTGATEDYNDMRLGRE